MFSTINLSLTIPIEFALFTPSEFPFGGMLEVFYIKDKAKKH